MGARRLNVVRRERRAAGLKVELLFGGCVSKCTAGSARSMLPKQKIREAAMGGCLSYL
jgi:hypothetical protein